MTGLKDIWVTPAEEGYRDAPADEGARDAPAAAEGYGGAPAMKCDG